MSRPGEELLSAVSLLWPESTTIRPGSGSGDSRVQRRELLVVPNARRPRLLLPARRPRAAAAVAMRTAGSGSPVDQLSRWALAGLLVTGLGDRALRDRITLPEPTQAPAGERGGGAQDIEAHLGSLLNEPVVVSVHVGTARANRKPVLQVLDHLGHTLAFAKVGHTGLAKELVRTEAQALRRLATSDLSSIQAPTLLHHGRWRGMELLVMTPLSVRSAIRRRVPDVPVQAMLELATSRANTSTVGEEGMPSRTRTTLTALRDERSRETSTAYLDSIERHWSGHPLDLGAWHGDWSPWNMSMRRAQVRLWDWERYAEDVPLGFDALHYRLQVLRFTHRLSWERAVPALLGDATGLLAPLGVPRESARLVTQLYLASLCSRYLHDGETDTGTPVRAKAAELLRVLTLQPVTSASHAGGVR